MIGMTKTTRLTFEGFRYQINKDGTVFAQMGALRNEPTSAPFTDQVIDLDCIKAVKAEAARLRRNRSARERADVMRSLGMKRTPYGWE